MCRALAAATQATEVIAPIHPPTVRPEPVEGLLFFPTAAEKQGFDKLSPNGLLVSGIQRG